MYTPSVYAHIFGGAVLVASILYLVLHVSKVVSRDPYQILVLMFLFSIAIGIHGLSHAGLEYVYNYNPLSLVVSQKDQKRVET
jgi:putative copper export protein